MNTLAGTWLAFLFAIHSLYFNVLHSKGGQLMNEIKWRALGTETVCTGGQIIYAL